MKVAIYFNPALRRSTHICQAWQKGLKRHNIPTMMLQENVWRREIEADIAIFYGLSGKIRKIQRLYAKYATAVLTDLGYFGRHDGGRLEGYHRVSVNALHATDYFQNTPHDDTRVKKFNLEIKQPRNNDNGKIVLVGQSEKAAEVFGLGAEEWERKAIATIREHSDRGIVYAPKPSWKDAKPIPGTEFFRDEHKFPELMCSAHAIVTHHSNAGIEALIEGVPVFSAGGLASNIVSDDLTEIEAPTLPSAEVRQQLINDVAYTQWKVNEMRSGEAWNYLVSEVIGQ